MRRTHGMIDTVEYRTWTSMKNRCSNERHQYYADYGGRGITVCDRWADNFMAFYNDMGPRPSKTHSIDRRDVNGNYCPENCRWATKLEQANNCRNSRYITSEGRTQTLANWAREVGLSKQTLLYRLNRGWPIERALTEPLNGSRAA